MLAKGTRDIKIAWKSNEDAARTSLATTREHVEAIDEPVDDLIPFEDYVRDYGHPQQNGKGHQQF